RCVQSFPPGPQVGFRFQTEPSWLSGRLLFGGPPLTAPYLSVKLTPSPATINQLQAQFLAILPRIQTHAQIRFRHLRCPSKREDAVAEVVAVAWKWFLRLDARGKQVGGFVSTLADYAVRHVRSCRGLCGQGKAKDVLSPLAQ